MANESGSQVVPGTVNSPAGAPKPLHGTERGGGGSGDKVDEGTLDSIAKGAEAKFGADQPYPDGRRS